MTTRTPEFAVSVDPGELHFNAAHFITFAGTCENLHGHNFHTRVDAWGDNTEDALVVDFVLLTRLARTICATLHDRVLLPGTSAVVTLRDEDSQIHVASYGKRFALPAENCAILPISNTTAELLAGYICEQLREALRTADALGRVAGLQVAVEEADRQWGICRLRT